MDPDWVQLEKDPCNPSETIEISPNTSASDNVARRSDEELVCSAPEIYHSQFWLNHVQIEKACRIAVDTAVSTAVLQPHPEGLEDYITATFGISKQNKTKVWQSSLSRQGVTCRLTLSCRVVNTRASKKATGQGHLYLRLGIVPTKNIADRVTKSGLLREGQEKGSAGDIFTSRTKLSTPESSWNEQFNIPLCDREESTLVVEMWNTMTCISQATDAKESASDVLIGWASCNAKTVSLQGEVMVLDLKKTTSGKKRGSIKIHMSVSGKTEQSAKVLLNVDHMMLYKALVMKESEQALKSWQKGFPSVLSSDGERLLHLHACYNGLSKLQEHSMRLSVLLGYNKSCPFLPGVFIPLVDLLISEYNLSCKEKVLQLGWVNEILNQFQTLLDESKKTLCDHLCMIDLSNKSGVAVLENQYSLLKKLYTLDGFVNRLPENDRSIQNAAIAFIKESFRTWFYNSVENQESFTSLSDAFLLRDTVQQCMLLCGVARSEIGPAIQKHIDVDYFSTLISALDDLLSVHTRQLCGIDVSQEEQLANALLDIYLSLKDINEVHILKYTNPRLCEQLQITKYQSWFKEVVPVWIKNIGSKCNKAIARSVETDEFLSSINEEVKFSHSSLDTISFLHNVKSFWDNLHWPPSEVVQYFISITQCITKEAINYVDKLCSIWPQYNCCTDATQFSVTKQSCIIISNIQHILEELKPAPLSNSSENELFIVTTEQNRSTIERQFQEASNYSCHQKLVTLCEQMGHQFEATMLTFIKGLGEPDTEENLLAYMNANLAFLRKNLPDPPFIMALQKIWTSVVHAFHSSDFRSGSTKEHSKIKDLLLSLHEGFQGGGNGLAEDQLDIEEYKVLLNELDSISQPTHRLVQDLCADLARQQAGAVSSCGLGMVKINVSYIRNQSSLEITMVGNSIPCKGLLHISLDILPRVNNCIILKKYPVKKKKLHGNSQSFSDELKVTVSEDTIRTEGGILVVGFHNKDRLIGICVVPCHDIPTSTDAATLLSASSPSRRRFDLALFQMKEPSAMNELVRRHKSDDEASAFLFGVYKQYMHSHPVSRMCSIM